MLLSILTCHLLDRRQALARLMRRLVPQCVTDFGECLNWDEILTILLHEQRLAFDQIGVEWLIDHTPKGVPDSSVEGGVRPVTIGEKRNNLLRRSIGSYVQFIDDDDLVAQWAVGRILCAIKSNPDVVGFWGIIKPKGPFSVMRDAKFIHSIKCKEWRHHNGVYERHSNHLNPVKRQHAMDTGYPIINHGEDRSYSDRLFPLLESEIMIGGIDDPMYEYYT